MSHPEITLTQTKVYEIRKFVSSRTARVYHDLNMTPRCGLGDSVFYEALCSLRVDDQLLNELEPRPSTTECFRCATKRLNRERAAISAAVAEVERPKIEMGPWTTLADALHQIAMLEARDGKHHQRGDNSTECPTGFDLLPSPRQLLHVGADGILQRKGPRPLDLLSR